MKTTNRPISVLPVTRKRIVWDDGGTKPPIGGSTWPRPGASGTRHEVRV